jgi:hypothetical protein
VSCLAGWGGERPFRAGQAGGRSAPIVAVQTSGTVSPKRSVVGEAANGWVGGIAVSLLSARAAQKGLPDTYEWIFTQALLHQHGETHHSLAHIGDAAGEINAQPRRECDHRRSNFARTHRNAVADTCGPTRTMTPPGSTISIRSPGRMAALHHTNQPQRHVSPPGSLFETAKSVRAIDKSMVRLSRGYHADHASRTLRQQRASARPSG